MDDLIRSELQSLLDELRAIDDAIALLEAQRLLLRDQISQRVGLLGCSRKLRGRKTDPRVNHARRIEAGSDLLQADERATEQPCARQQHECERRFQHHERLPEFAPATALDASTARADRTR